jgi:hypothetical protein
MNDVDFGFGKRCKCLIYSGLILLESITRGLGISKQTLYLHEYPKPRRGGQSLRSVADVRSPK